MSIEYSGRFQKILAGRSTEMVGIEFELQEAVYIWTTKEDRGSCSATSSMYALTSLLELKTWSEYGKNIYIYIWESLFLVIACIWVVFIIELLFCVTCILECSIAEEPYVKCK